MSYTRHDQDGRFHASTLLREVLRGNELELQDENWIAISRAVKARNQQDPVACETIVSSLVPKDDVQSFALIYIRLVAAIDRDDRMVAKSLTDSIQQHPVMDEPFAKALAGFRIGQAVRMEFRLEQAMALQMDAAAVFRELGWSFEEALCVVEIGNIMRARGDAAGALRCYLSVLDTIQKDGGEDLHARMLVNLAGVLFASGNIEEAERRFSQALQTSTYSLPGPARVDVLVRLGFLHKAAGRIDAAKESYLEAMSMIDLQQPSVMAARIRCSLAELAEMSGDHESALAQIEDLHSTHADFMLLRQQLQSYAVKARALRMMARHAESAEALRTAMNLARASDEIELRQILLADALEYVDDSDLRMEILEDYRIIQDERMKATSKSASAMLDLRVSFEQEQSRREVSRQKEIAALIVDTQTATLIEIGRELHDSLGQDLTVMLRLADRMADNEQRFPEDLVPVVATLRDVSRRAAHDVRRISHLLADGGVSSRGIADALRGMRDETAQAVPELDLKVLTFGSLEEMPQTIARTLYRVTQSLVQNVVKHSRATRCTVNLVVHPDHYHLDIEDNGIGFDTSEASSGMGLRESRARIELMGGSVRVESSPGRGTYVEVTLPSPT